MGHYTHEDLESQQEALARSHYDVRVTNLARFIYKKLPKKKGRFIDIGAGNGLVLKFFKNKGFEVSGIELSPELCALMKKDPRLKGVVITQGDIATVTGREDYDYVLASDVIEHLKDDTKALQNLYSFVKPGGMLLLTVPAHSFLFGKRDHAWGHFRRYDKKDLQNKLKKLGGRIEFIGEWNFLGFLLYFVFEKVLKQSVKEDFRHKNSFPSRMIRSAASCFLRLEEAAGGVPLGLTLYSGIRKTK